MYQIKFKSHIKLPFRNLSHVSEKTAPFLSLERSNHSTKLWPNLHYSINYAYTLLKQETSSFARKKLSWREKNSYVCSSVCVPRRFTIRILVLDTVGSGTIVGVGISLIFINWASSMILDAHSSNWFIDGRLTHTRGPSDSWALK